MRELKTSEIEAVSGGLMTKEPTSPFERLAFQVAIVIAARHFGIKLLPTKAAS